MTQQDRQLKKVKLYRVLKVVFYSLGLPLFVMAVFLASVRFIGNDPFTGNSTIASQLGFFRDINILFTSPALYGVWIALGIWAVIAIVHIVLAKTVKSRKVRAMSVTAFTLVVMFSCLLGLDVGMSGRVESIAKDAPSTVTVQDYKTLLSYYRTISSSAHGKNLTESLIDKIETLEKVYNVEMEGAIKTGTAGAISNKPVTYYNIISDDGETGIDIGFKTENGQAMLDYSGSNGNYTMNGNGIITREVEGTQVVRLAPASDGSLVINGKKYSHYWARIRGAVNGTTVYTWYCRDMQSTAWSETDGNTQVTNRKPGVYGDALYSQNGLVSDGWVFSVENVLEILEDYYEAKAAIDSGDAKYYAYAYADMYNNAWIRRDNYYNNEADAWLKALYNQEVYMSERFSLTRGELDELIAKVGALLGDNKLFDYLFSGLDDTLNSGDMEFVGDIVNKFLGGSLGDFFKKLNNGIGLSTFGLDSATLGTITDILCLLTGKTYDYVDDLILTVSYKAPDCYNVKHENLYVGIARGVGEWKFVESDGSVGDPVPVHRKKVINKVIVDGVEKEEIEWVWVYDQRIPDGSGADIDVPFTTTEIDGKLYDKDNKEVRFVIAPGSDPAADMIIDIDFNDEIRPDSPGNIFDIINGTDTYAFDLDTLSAFLNNGLNRVLERYEISLSEGTVGTIVNLVKTLGVLQSIDVNGETYTGLVISGIEIPILDSAGKVALDINGILENLLKGWYGYQSAVIKPVWEFYVDTDLQNDDPNNEYVLAQMNYAKYERALYTGKTYGGMIGSTIIGDSLGTGSYPSSFGLGDLASVQQLKVNMSYQPEYFPLMALRDMIVLFSGLVIMFYFISFVAAQREDDYATGKMVARSRKRKEEKETKKHEASVIAEFDANNGEKAASSAGGADDAQKSDSQKSDEGEKDAQEGAPQENSSQTDTASPEQGTDGTEKTGEDPAIPVNQNSDEEVL